jgi:hypothetical protein
MCSTEFIKIQKMISIDNVGYYKVETDDFGGGKFYMGIDKAKRMVYFYVNENCSIPAVIIDYDSDIEQDDKLPGVSTQILGRALYKAAEVFNMNTFPETLHY